MTEVTVQSVARLHERDSGHRMHGIDGSYSACRDCEFEVEKNGPLGVIVVRHEDGYDVAPPAEGDDTSTTCSEAVGEESESLTRPPEKGG